MISFTEEERKTIHDRNEAFQYHNRVTQYSLIKATKGEPHSFALQCNRMNASSVETWRQLHATYDQGQLEGSTTAHSQPNHESNVEQHYIIYSTTE
eukprot:1573860-Amphidinium_carterae.1